MRRRCGQSTATDEQWWRPVEIARRRKSLYDEVHLFNSVEVGVDIQLMSLQRTRIMNMVTTGHSNKFTWYKSKALHTQIAAYSDQTRPDLTFVSTSWRHPWDPTLGITLRKMSVMANTTPIVTTVTKPATKEKTPKDADATPRVNIQDFCEEHYEDIMPVIMDKIRHDKRKEVHARLDFGESPKKRRIREGSQKTSAQSLSARYRNPSERLKVRDRLRYNDQHVLDRLGETFLTDIILIAETAPAHRRIIYNTPSSMVRGTKHGYRSLQQRPAPRYEKEGGEVNPQVDIRSLVKKGPELQFQKFTKTRMPNNVKTYDGTGDPEDQVKNFQAAAQIWFDDLPSRGIDGYNDLKAASLAYFMHKKKYVKDPVKIYNIKQRDGETIEEFMKRFKTMEEMMIATTAFIRGETAAAGKKKGHTSWRAQDQSKRTLRRNSRTKGPLVIEAEISGHMIHRMYVDGDMTGVPQSVAEHRLNIQEGYSPVRQKKRGQAPERAKAIQQRFHGPKQGMSAGLLPPPFPKSTEIRKSIAATPLRVVWILTKDNNQIEKCKVQMKRKQASIPAIAEKSLPLFKTLKKCIKKSDFHWTPDTEQAFKQLKQNLSELPLLVAPQPKEELIVYMSASHGAISAVLMTERGTVQTPIYFVRRVLQGPELNYTPMEKLILSLVFAAKRLRSVMLGEHNITYRPRTSVKGEILADFLVEKPDEGPPNTSVVETPQEPWTLFTDGSSCVDGSGAALILTSPKGTEFTYALRFQFTASNNEAEYEALIAGLRIAAQMGVRNVHVSVDSKLVANQVLGAYVAKEENMIKYLEKVKSLMNGFANFSISQVPRSKNKKVDALSKIASTSFTHLSKQVLVEILKEKSIQEKEVTTVVEEYGLTWMTPIIEYFKVGTLP
ncbi:reverse transcriptase domain-containing protein [Tanacetum coccineum]|uniref:Reverse transcriptase domain-containing protein n=1 Tax=Tanacetum coccineum TaxID=301880 RepID=A0ABQ5FTM1_9ASTR